MSDTNTTRRTSAASDTHDTVRAYFTELEAGRFDAALRHYSADAVGTLHGHFGPARRQEVANYLSELREAFPDLSFQVLDLIAENDTAAIRWRVRGTFSGPGRFMGFRPTGAALDFEGLDIGEVADGKIQRLDGYADGMTIARQLGLMPRTGSVGERVMTGALNARTVIARRLSRRSRR
jgi:predicted ester cyclase